MVNVNVSALNWQVFLKIHKVSFKNTEIREKSVISSFQFLYIENSVYAEETWQKQKRSIIQ